MTGARSFLFAPNIRSSSFQAFFARSRIVVLLSFLSLEHLNRIFILLDDDAAEVDLKLDGACEGPTQMIKKAIEKNIEISILYVSVQGTVPLYHGMIHAYSA